jgi:hypothetical protein
MREKIGRADEIRMEEHEPSTLPLASHERLLSAREAALLLSVNPTTAQLRAWRALRCGDPAVRTVAGAYVAPAG